MDDGLKPSDLILITNGERTGWFVDKREVIYFPQVARVLFIDEKNDGIRLYTPHLYQIGSWYPRIDNMSWWELSTLEYQLVEKDNLVQIFKKYIYKNEPKIEYLIDELNKFWKEKAAPIQDLISQKESELNDLKKQLEPLREIDDSIRKEVEILKKSNALYQQVIKDSDNCIHDYELISHESVDRCYGDHGASLYSKWKCRICEKEITKEGI